MQSKKNTQIIKKLFLENFKDAKSELQFKNNYELIVCVILSAQCTDKRVNLITPALFEKYPSVRDLAKANLASLKFLIQSCSFFNNKAANLIKMAQAVVNEFGGEIPLDESSLKSLSGVGVKTAHVVLIEKRKRDGRRYTRFPRRPQAEFDAREDARARRHRAYAAFQKRFKQTPPSHDLVWQTDVQGHKTAL